MFNILTYGKRNNVNIGILPLYNTLGVDWKDSLDKYDLFNFVSLKRMKPNVKYTVFITFNGHFKTTDGVHPLYDCQELPNPDQVDTRLSEFYMPERVRKDSKQGLVHWVIDYNTECFQLDKLVGINFDRICQLLHTTSNNITLITGGETVSELGNSTLAYAAQLGYNCITGHDLYNFIDIRKGNPNDEVHNTYSSQKIRNIINGANLKYKSLCYNRLPRQHRTVIVAHIIKNNYHNDCLYSLGIFPNGDRWHLLEEFPELSTEITQLLSGPDIYPHIREPEVDLAVNQADTLGWEHGLNSYFQLVTETMPTTNKIPFITEKSMKPFAMLQPFVQYGPKDNIKVLRMYGYQLFDDWIDHSYDDEEDDIKRLRMVLTEFDRLQKIPAETWSKMLQEMLSQLLHNNKLVKIPPIYDFTSQLIPILAKFIKDPYVQ
jgi:hypothetical protein